MKIGEIKGITLPEKLSKLDYVEGSAGYELRILNDGFNEAIEQISQIEVNWKEVIDINKTVNIILDAQEEIERENGRIILHQSHRKIIARAIIDNFDKVVK